MGRLKRYTRSNRSRAVDLTGRVNAAAHSSRESRSVTPVRPTSLPSYFHKARRTNYPGGKDSVKMPHKIRLGGRRGYSKGMVTPSTKDPSQDSTSMIMPSGVSSFLLDCMDLDTEAEDTLPSIEMFRKADTYDEGTGLVSEDEMLHRHVKNSTLLDLSHAEDIAMQQPPNLSSILELSPVIDGQAAKESFCLSPPLPVSPLSSSPLLKQNKEPSKSPESTTSTAEVDIKTCGDEERTPETKRVVVLSPVVKRRPFTGRDKPIKCRKVTFNDIVSTRDISVFKPQVESQTDPQEPSSERAKFFDFADQRERAVFFQRLKKTYTFQFPAKPIT
ncbi:uncharacterized protein [Salminus brasiliensis]|uniref:uncharacterized protein n=1 Tax=Salminus brasiliensis TaxID=930266 RepID=UPI003B82D2AD